jgi:hypothetical protein
MPGYKPGMIFLHVMFSFTIWKTQLPPDTAAKNENGFRQIKIIYKKEYLFLQVPVRDLLL